MRAPSTLEPLKVRGLRTRFELHAVGLPAVHKIAPRHCLSRTGGKRRKMSYTQTLSRNSASMSARVATQDLVIAKCPPLASDCIARRMVRLGALRLVRLPYQTCCLFGGLSS